MPDHHIDSGLMPWADIGGSDWSSLLLGNGFSMNIWRRFEYASLYEAATDTAISPSLNAKCISLFKSLETLNFEDVLRVLYHARLVDELLSSTQIHEIDSLYSTTKNALAAAVNHFHVPYGFSGLSSINASLQSFRDIFTTNYDLIPYWAIMHNSSKFKDLFWGSDNVFDSRDSQVSSGSCTIHYLHGAIHLVELPDGRTKKLRANGDSSLSQLFDVSHPNYFPLFIAEGASRNKLSRIMRNEYLRFCYDKLRSIEGNLVAIGHSFCTNYDQHIVDALRDGRLNAIAIGVWPHQDPSQICLFKSRLQAAIAAKAIYFFDSTTHPLGDKGLRQEQ